MNITVYKMRFLIKPENDDVKEMYDNHHDAYYNGDSGLDLFIVKDFIIPPGKTEIVDLGISCQLFDKKTNMYFSYIIYSRSSIAKTPLILATGSGICDSGYTGTLMDALHNTSSEPFVIKKGERYVQLARADLGSVRFSVVDSLRTTTRGSGGFGSSGH